MKRPWNDRQGSCVLPVLHSDTDTAFRNSEIVTLSMRSAAIIRRTTCAANIFTCEYFIDTHLGELFTPAHHYKQCRLLSSAANQRMPIGQWRNNSADTVIWNPATNFLLCASLLILDRNWWIFFTYIRPNESRSIGYYYTYLILALRIFQRQWH